MHDFLLNGTVPIAKAIPFGLQHILAMFVAGIATLIQLYPIWKIGSRLPVVMGVSFTFVTVLCTVAANYGYSAVIGSVIIGGLMEGTLGLLAKYWRKLITPVERISETAFCTCRSYCWLCDRHFYGKSRS